MNNASIHHKVHFLSKQEAVDYYNSFTKEIEWQQRDIVMFGKQLKEPRLTAWYGDKGTAYSYSGIELDPLEWTDSLLSIKLKVEEAAEQSFNSVLLNWYRDGNDSMGWHSDDEKELGRNPTIASLSLGATRDFQIRRKDNHKEKRQFELTSGSLLIMSGEMQHYWQHQIPKRKRVDQGRMNLTFRKILF